jgi:hypothetical protein
VCSVLCALCSVYAVCFEKQKYALSCVVFCCAVLCFAVSLFFAVLCSVLLCSVLLSSFDRSVSGHIKQHITAHGTGVLAAQRALALHTWSSACGCNPPSSQCEHHKSGTLWIRPAPLAYSPLPPADGRLRTPHNFGRPNGRCCERSRRHSHSCFKQEIEKDRICAV